MNRALRLGIIICGALTSIGVAGYLLLAFVVAPRLEPGRSVTLLKWSFSKPTPQPKLLPTVRGDLLLVGELRKAGRPLPNARFVFLFQDLFRSPEISTDADGRFAFRLPPGMWRFFGPVIVGNEIDKVSYTFVPAIATPTPTFEVGSGSTDRTVHVRIVHGHAGPNDL
jgi:hypothetical protein